MPKIYYLCPDFAPPSGGTRNLYWHVSQLRDAGWDAWIMHQKPDFKLTWPGLAVPTTSIAALNGLDPADVLVFTEVMLPLIQQLATVAVRKVVLAMNWHPEYWKLQPGDNWAKYGIQAVITPSKIIAEYVQWRLGLPTTVIASHVNPELYYVEPVPKQPTIAYSPRKMVDHHILRGAFDRREGLFQQFKWLEMINFSQAEYAQHLRQAAVYLTPSPAEGLNISVLEAMACGCLVVGYHGVGGDEFMIGAGGSQNCILVPNGHLPRFGQILWQTLTTWAEQADAFAPILQNAIATAQCYQDKHNQAQQLSAFFTNLSNQPLGDRVGSQPVVFPSATPQATHQTTSTSLTESPAIRLIQQATQAKQAGDLQTALALYHQALALDQNMPELWFNYGNLLNRLKQYANAQQAYQRAIAIQPSFYQAHLNLANALRDADQQEAAVNHYQQAIAIKPDFLLAYRNLIQVLISLDRLAATVDLFAAWVRLEPANPVPWNGQGVALEAKGEYERAQACFQQALNLNPREPDSLNNMGALLCKLGCPHDAISYLRQAIDLDANNSTALNNLTDALIKLGYITEAIAQVEKVVQQQPDSAAAAMILGYALVQQARITEALAWFERSWQLKSTEPRTISNALFAMFYRDDLTAAALTQDCRRWTARFTTPGDRYESWQGNLDPYRRLKIGYLSGDLRSHPVAFFLEPILTHHRSAQVEITCYDTKGMGDETSARLKAATDRWCNCAGWEDDRLAQQIHTDAIDILVDLSGHTSGNRALMLMHKPAPIQILYIGYPGTTGLAAIDYIISDAAVSPPTHEELYTEKVLRVEGSFWCFQPHEFAPPPGELPALTNDYITFGSFNNTPKLSAATIKLWSQVLQAVPNSRLHLKALALQDHNTCDRFRSQFIDQGIDPERILFEKPTLKFEDFLNAYQAIDLALDPTPYNGGTTTCQALWMGIPVITLRGEHFFSRMSHSFLTQLGLTECTTATEAEYVAAAVALASDRQHLQQLRQTLRNKMRASLICNGAYAAQSLEAAYRQAWQAYCEAVST
jgi:protein O-GlcNAc transferase